MGCCFSDDADGEGKVLRLNRTDTQTVDITTPVTFEVPVQFKANVKIKLTAKDKNRTVEVTWLNLMEKEKFDGAFNSLFGARYTPDNALSNPEWKTCRQYEQSDVIGPGMYHLVIRSSSVISDKKVAIRGRIIKEEVRD